MYLVKNHASSWRKDCTSSLFEKVIELEKKLFKCNTIYTAKRTNMDQMTQKLHYLIASKDEFDTQPDPLH